MPETSNPANPTTAFDPNHPDPRMKRRCRSLTVKGIQCRQAAMHRFDYCSQHFNRGPHAFPRPGHITVPLLEDHASIQLMCTQVFHAVVNLEMAPEVANQALRACRIAGTTLPRPARLKASDRPEPTPEAVSDFSADEYGNWIGPREAYRGPDQVFEPTWAWSKYMYECLCDRLGRPRPTCAADFPAAGWLTEEEMAEDPEQLGQRYQARIAQLKKESDARHAEETAAALAAGLPDPHKITPVPCPHRVRWCMGPSDIPGKVHRCCDCHIAWNDIQHGLLPEPTTAPEPAPSSDPSTATPSSDAPLDLQAAAAATPIRSQLPAPSCGLFPRCRVCQHR